MKIKGFTDSESQLIRILKEFNSPITPAQIIRKLNITKQRFYVVCAPLLDKGVIFKTGKTPKVFYSINKEYFTSLSNKGVSKENQEEFLKKGISEKELKDFYIITPDGREMEGEEAFVEWCKKRKENPLVVLPQYIKTIDKYNKLKIGGLIDATSKAELTFKDMNQIDKMFYTDFYSIERFGKTKLGQMLLYAKKSQDKNLSIKSINIVKEKIINFIKKEKFDAVGFIPPTEYRKYQFMDTLRKELNLNLPIVNLVKIKTNITVPQKTFSKIEDRIENAKKTIFVDDQRVFKKVLLLDDAVGSGSTFNEVAIKIKNQKISRVVWCLSIVGSYNGFEVINEA